MFVDIFVVVNVVVGPTCHASFSEVQASISSCLSFFLSFSIRIPGESTKG
jgi:hypothetical protein